MMFYTERVKRIITEEKELADHVVRKAKLILNDLEEILEKNAKKINN